MRIIKEKTVLYLLLHLKPIFEYKLYNLLQDLDYSSVSLPLIQ